MTDDILVFITTASVQEAEQIANALVAKRLAACGNIVPDIRSVFWWKAAIETAPEALLILKSRTALFPAITDMVQALHSYEVPEIIAMPILFGSESYLRWIDQETSPLQM